MGKPLTEKWGKRAKHPRKISKKGYYQQPPPQPFPSEMTSASKRLSSVNYVLSYLAFVREVNLYLGYPLVIQEVDCRRSVKGML